MKGKTGRIEIKMSGKDKKLWQRAADERCESLEEWIARTLTWEANYEIHGSGEGACRIGQCCQEVP